MQVDRPRQVRARGSVHPGVAVAGRALRGRVLPDVRRGRLADPQPGASLAGPLLLPREEHRHLQLALNGHFDNVLVGVFYNQSSQFSTFLMPLDIMHIDIFLMV